MSMRKKEAAMIARMNAAQHSSCAAVPAPESEAPAPAAPEAEEVSRRQKAPIEMLKPSDCLAGGNKGTKSFPIRPYS